MLSNSDTNSDQIVPTLISAIEGGHHQISELLLRNEINVIKTFKKACEIGNLCVVKYLMKYYEIGETIIYDSGSTTISSTTITSTPLHWAIKHDQDKIVKLFIEENPERLESPCLIEISSVTKNFYPLWMAAKFGSLQCLSLLIQLGANIEKYSGYIRKRGFMEFERTALCIAAEKKQEQATRLLIHHGAKTDMSHVVIFTNCKYGFEQVKGFIEEQKVEVEKELERRALEKQYAIRACMLDVDGRREGGFVDIVIETQLESINQ